jgi:PEP-CTERM motif
VVAMCSAPFHAAGILQFDELGNLFYSVGGGPFVAEPGGTLQADPSGAVAGDVLVYNLTSELTGFELINGDNPIGGYGGIAGDLRFTDGSGDLTGDEICGTGVGQTTCYMTYYVFVDNGLPADVDPPSLSFLLTQTPATTLNQGQFSLLEGSMVVYDGTIVPEPATAAMLMSGLVGLFLIRKRSKKAA